MPVDALNLRTSPGAVFEREAIADAGEGAGAMLRDVVRMRDTAAPWLWPASYGEQARAVTVGGRQAAWFVEAPLFGQAVLRQYRRGGLVARVSRDRYLWQGEERTRSFAELRLLARLCEAGVRVPTPLAAGYWRTGLTYRAAILIARIPRVQTLTECVAAGPLSNATALAVAHEIAAMHRAGVWHADLNAFNILLDADGHAWLIDFDRGRYGAVIPKERRANLLRLRRSLQKVAGAAGLLAWQSIDAAYRKAWESLH